MCLWLAIPLLLSREGSLAANADVHLPNSPSKLLTMVPQIQNRQLCEPKKRCVYSAMYMYVTGNSVAMDCLKYRLCVSMIGGMVMYLF